MADDKPTSKYYQLKGVNQKTSKYEFPEAEALALYNLDFDTPNAWQKRPGTTFGIGNSLGTSGPIKSLFEFTKLTGESYIVAASDTALFYLTAGGYTVLSTGWNNGQPPDILTFANKMYVANGQSFAWFDGSNFFNAGMPTQRTVADPTPFGNVGGTYYLVAGATSLDLNSSFTFITNAVYVAYAYLRTDGYMGPINFLRDARNIVTAKPGNGGEYFNVSNTVALQGLTIPSGFGISAIALYIAGDSVTNTSATAIVSTGLFGGSAVVTQVGNLGFYAAGTGAGGARVMSLTLLPNADTSRFHFWTLVTPANLFLTTDANSITMWGTTMTVAALQPLSQYQAVSTSDGYSGMTFDFFSTYTPRYIEICNNIMMSAGSTATPSTIWPSEVGQPEYYLPENFIEVRTNDGDRIYATKNFNNYLVVMKENSFHKLIGNSADTFQLIEISSQYGCLSNQAVVQVKQSLFWLDKKGILEYNGASFDIISTPVEQIFRRMNVSAAKDQATAVHHIYRNQIWFGIPIDGSTVNNVTVVYDYLIGGWTFFDGFNPSSFGYIRGPLQRPTAWRGDYSGMVHYYSESFFADSGKGISCVALTRFENVGGENQTTLWRRFFLDVAQNNSGITGQINCQFFSNYDSSTVRATFAMYQSQYQTRAEIGVQGKAVAAQIGHFSASLPLLIDGYAWANRGLRNV